MPCGYWDDLGEEYFGGCYASYADAVGVSSYSHSRVCKIFRPQCTYTSSGERPGSTRVARTTTCAYEPIAVSDP